MAEILYSTLCVYKEQNKLLDYTIKYIEYICKWNLIPHFKWMEKFTYFHWKIKLKGMHKSFHTRNILFYVSGRVERLGGWRNQKHTFTFTLPPSEILHLKYAFYSNGLFSI